MQSWPYAKRALRITCKVDAGSSAFQHVADGNYLRAEVGLSGLRAVELQPLPNALPEHVQGRVGLHDLGHGLRDEGLHPSEPVPKGAVQVVRQINAHHHT